MELPNVSLSLSAKDKSEKRRYAFACAACKRRKIKCSGARPVCHSCLRHQEPCDYIEKSSNGTGKGSKNRLNHLNDLIDRLKESNAEQREKLLSEFNVPIPSIRLDSNSNLPQLPPQPAASTSLERIAPGSTTSRPAPAFLPPSSSQPHLHSLSYQNHLTHPLVYPPVPHARSLSHPVTSISRSASHDQPWNGLHELANQASTFDRELYSPNPSAYYARDAQPFPRSYNSPLGPSIDTPYDPALEDEALPNSEAPPAKVSYNSTSGDLQYYGSTSHLHIKPLKASNSPTSFQPNQSRYESERTALRASTALQKMWEQLAFNNLLVDGTSGDISKHLLNTYWSWQYPIHMAVYRPLFVRDMALGGPYFNAFLLNVIYAHACRYADYTPPSGQPTEDDYMAKAKLLLMAELEKPTSIPTIQGLIILGGRDCAVGRYSQGWLWTGMAARMMKDMGIHLDGENEPFLMTLPPEEREVRRRLFWSQFTWDKSISLCLGRGPTWHEAGAQPPPHMIDDSEDDIAWTPHYLSEDRIPKELKSYEPQQSFIVTTFKTFCQLAEIINAILNLLYVSSSDHLASRETLHSLDNRLLEFWNSVSPNVKIDPNNLPPQCPAPHMITLNLLRHATRILLYRPFIISLDQEIAREAKHVSTLSARAIHCLLILHQKTFQNKNFVYLARYCIYVAATVAAADIRSQENETLEDAAQRLSLCLKVLEMGIQKQSPGFTKSIEILKQQLKLPIRSTLMTDIIDPTDGQNMEPILPPEEAVTINDNLNRDRGTLNDRTVPSYMEQPSVIPLSLFPEQISTWPVSDVASAAATSFNQYNPGNLGFMPPMSWSFNNYPGAPNL